MISNGHLLRFRGFFLLRTEQFLFVLDWTKAPSVSATSLIAAALHPVAPRCPRWLRSALLNWRFLCIGQLPTVRRCSFFRTRLTSGSFCPCSSTDDSMSGLVRKSLNDEGDVYTSLLSGQSFASGQGSSYLSDTLKASETSLGSSGLGDFSSDSYSFSSNVKMADDMPKSLFSSDKTESYNYMDISHGDERHDQRLGDKGSKGHDSLGGYIDKNPGGDEDDEEEEEEEENLGPALGSHSFPYVEEPSDEELSDYRSYRNLGGTPQTASPVKITLTESQPTSARPDVHHAPPPVSVSERENILSVGLQGVPTVTLSEPEDDSPASSPNASPTREYGRRHRRKR